MILGYLPDGTRVVTGDYDCPPEVDRYIYCGQPSGNVVLFTRCDPAEGRGYWKTTDLHGVIG